SDNSRRSAIKESEARSSSSSPSSFSSNKLQRAATWMRSGRRGSCMTVRSNLPCSERLNRLTGQSATRVGGDRDGFACAFVLADDVEALVPTDDVFHVGDLVAGRDHEPGRVGAHMLVGRQVEL